MVKTERLRSESLTPAQRTPLFDRLYAVYSETMWGHTREEFEKHLLSAGDLSLTLYYGDRGEFAGFAYIAIQSVEHGRKPVAAFSAGGFFRPGYHGGVAGMLFGLREAIRFKLRRPRTALGYLSRTSSPAAYQLFVKTMPLVYPNRFRQTPVDIESLVRAIGERRRYVRVGESPWVVHSDAVPRDASRLRRLVDDADARFCVQLNPRFAEGEALLIWIPLNAATIVGGLYRQVRLRLGR
ncbi:hypothetical protein BST12_23930 [Mycobacterium angelicum]|uniref:N-acetyltransferase domain-containing protein n=1 Tax=Mycobacterium angelicum TaxID=470074 RepID=A0A1W9ZEM0_MYCAN|nr:hypothetical protein [Mycobacterium angelicum]ORA13484.1 hypothetical protein BST12_23930 [Mycobacterium angelicum]